VHIGRAGVSGPKATKNHGTAVRDDSIRFNSVSSELFAAGRSLLMVNTAHRQRVTAL